MCLKFWSNCLPLHSFFGPQSIFQYWAAVSLADLKNTYIFKLYRADELNKFCYLSCIDISNRFFPDIIQVKTQEDSRLKTTSLDLEDLGPDISKSIKATTKTKTDLKSAADFQANWQGSNLILCIWKIRPKS